MGACFPWLGMEIYGLRRMLDGDDLRRCREAESSSCGSWLSGGEKRRSSEPLEKLRGLRSVHKDKYVR